MGTNQSKKEEEIIITQTGNSGETTGLQQIKLTIWEVIGLLLFVVGLGAVGYFLWRRCRNSTKKQIRREISKSHELVALGMNAKTSV